LDIGTGPGTLPFAITDMIEPKAGIRIVGIDPSESAIENARKTAIELKRTMVEFERGSFEEIPFPDAAFDLVISNASFNLSTEKEDAIREMGRVVKDEGKVILADCFRKEDAAHKDKQQCNDRLWAVCISGAVEKSWLIDHAKPHRLHLNDSKDLTNIVADLIRQGKWNWREFIDFDLEYCALEFIKTVNE